MSDSKHLVFTTPTTNQLQLDWNGLSCSVLEIDEFAFQVESDDLAAMASFDEAAEIQDGQISLEDESVSVQFRIRGATGSTVRCGFYDLPIKQRERILAMRQRVLKPVSDELQTLSYDDLAKGNTDKSPERVTDAPTNTSTIKKAAAAIVLGLAMFAIVSWIIFVVRSRSTITVANSVVVGNYHAVNTPHEGQLIDVMVSVGDTVQAGQVLATISNPEVADELPRVETSLRRAERELIAYQQHAQQLQSTIGFARRKIDNDELVAKAEMAKIDAEMKSANSQLNRLRPLLAAGNIGVAEYEEAAALVAGFDADKLRQRAVMSSIGLSKTALKSDVMIGEAAVSSPLSDARRDIELAEAAVAELRETKLAIEANSKPIELVAPAMGTIYAVYRRRGEYLKVADEAMAISLAGGGWATGHVLSSVATNVKPGQKVEIDIPSLGLMTNGVVSAIGHRAVYGRGGYNAEFRAGPYDVPIRVTMESIEQQVPSGLRLNMTVRVHDHLAAARNYINGWLGRETPVEPDVMSMAQPELAVQGAAQ